MSSVAGVTVTVRPGITVTVTVAVLLQLFASVPVTLYVVVAAGDSVKDATFCPLFQTYVVPPFPVIVVLKPMQMAVGEAVAVMFGNGFTVSMTVVVPVQPAVVVPVTVYVVDAVGDTVKLAPAPDGLHVYELAPVAAIVELWPAQTAMGVAVAETVGSGFTVSVTVVVPVQPHASVPVTLYVVVAVGLAEKLVPVPAGLHVYVDAPLAAIVEL